jgi:2-desacetyl-2-hydroxyethyl bacteriochlorophyllide A dehydrogenase
MPVTASTMQVAVYRGDGKVPVEALAVPDLADRPHDVLVEVAYCGICGTDLHAIVEGGGPNGWGAPGFVGGHEWSGTVHAVGGEVTRWRVGDRVTAASSACGTCLTCRAGRPSLCRSGGAWDELGAFSQFMRRRENALEPLPEGLDMRAAALAEPLAVALHAVTRSTARSGQRVLVTGAGPIGTLTVVALHSRGVDDITVSEPNPLRRDLAARLGVVVVSPEELDGPERAFEAAIETSGNPQAASAAVASLTPGGTFVLVGVNTKPTEIDMVQVLVNELVVTGSALYDVGGIGEALDLLASGTVPVDVVIEPMTIGLEGVGEACAKLAGGQLAGKVLVVPN